MLHLYVYRVSQCLTKLKFISPGFYRWLPGANAPTLCKRASIPISRLSRRGAGKALRPDSEGIGLSFGMVLVADLLSMINMLLGKVFSQLNFVRVF
jgi:hypothetical protein